MIDHASYMNNLFWSDFLFFAILNTNLFLSLSSLLHTPLLHTRSGHRQVWFDYDSIDSGTTWYRFGRRTSAKEAAEHGRYRGLLHRIGRLHLYAGQLRQGHLPGDPEDLRDPDAGPVGVRDAGQAALLTALRIPAELGHHQIVLDCVFEKQVMLIWTII